MCICVDRKWITQHLEVLTSCALLWNMLWLIVYCHWTDPMFLIWKGRTTEFWYMLSDNALSRYDNDWKECARPSCGSLSHLHRDLGLTSHLQDGVIGEKRLAQRHTVASFLFSSELTIWPRSSESTITNICKSTQSTIIFLSHCVISLSTVCELDFPHIPQPDVDHLCSSAPYIHANSRVLDSRCPPGFRLYLLAMRSLKIAPRLGKGGGGHRGLHGTSCMLCKR